MTVLPVSPQKASGVSSLPFLAGAVSVVVAAMLAGSPASAAPKPRAKPQSPAASSRSAPRPAAAAVADPLQEDCDRTPSAVLPVERVIRRLAVTEKFECPEYPLPAEISPPSLAAFAPEAELIDGEQFPRHGKRQYRGIQIGNPQYDPARAIGAMLGDERSLLPSYIFSEIREILLRRKSLEASPLKKDIGYNRHVSDALPVLLKCGHMNEAEATRYASVLVTHYFTDNPPERLKRIFLDARAEIFDDSPEEAMYSSLFPMVSGWYGGQVVVFRESEPRSLDLNHWQLKNAGKALAAQPPGDNGEIITPGWVPSADIEGFWLKPKEDKSITEKQAIARGYAAELDWALYRVDHGGKKYVAVLDARGTKCVQPGGDGKFYACDMNYPNPSVSGVKPYPQIDMSRPLPVAGVVALCQPGKKCATPKALFEKLGPASERPVGPGLQKAIRHVTAASSVGTLFAPGASEPVVQADAVELVEASLLPADTYPEAKKGNVTDRAKAYCDGKARCPYRVNTTYLPDVAPGRKKSFEIRWSCGEGTAEQVLSLSAERQGERLELTCSPGSIDVVEATFGGNLIAPADAPRKPLDVTARLAHVCGFQSACKFPVSVLGGPAEHGGLQVRYRCGTGQKVKETLYKTGDFSLKCGEVAPPKEEEKNESDEK